MRTLRSLLMTLVMVLAILAPLGACRDEVPPKNLVTSIRILATRADLPYAHPGETVNIAALVVDGRAPADPSIGQTQEPMRVHWIPVPCINPKPKGTYYDCYSQIEAPFPIGVDLTPQLPLGTLTTISIPNDALVNVPTIPGRTEPAVTAYGFVAACGGHLERIPRYTNVEANSPPFACFTADHRMVDADNFVFGFTRVSVFNTRRNAIPLITGLNFRDAPVTDISKGVSVGHCHFEIWESHCDTWSMSVDFDDSAAEIDPENLDKDNHPQRETLFVDYFTTLGQFTDDRRIVFDPSVGRPPDDRIQWRPWQHAGKGRAWAVLHDNRGGTSWIEFPIELLPTTDRHSPIVPIP